jgi:4-amino-4-deoxy-L-arabinose transferase-like glycosyltransferase
VPALPWTLWLLLAVPFLGLGSAPLFDLDEGAFTAATTEMFLRGDFWSTYLLGEPRTDKPILIYWLQAASIWALGPSEWAFRLPSALAGSAWIAITYLFVHRVADPGRALLAALIIATAAGVSVILRAATADALLNLWLAASAYAAWLWLAEGRARWRYLGFAAMALGFLTKGPVAVVVPAAAVFLWCVSRGEWRRFFQWGLSPGPVLVFLALASPWFIVQYLREGATFFEGFFLKHNLQRYDSAMEGHRGQYFYYLWVVPLSLLPHTGWLLAAFARARQVWDDPLQRFGLLWFLFVLVFFSFSGTKLPHYVYYGYGGLVLVLVGQTHLNRYAAFVPAVLWFALLAALPWLLNAAIPNLRLDDRLLASDLGAQFGSGFVGVFAALFLANLYGLLRGRTGQRLIYWQGVTAATAFAWVLLPAMGGLLQDPIRHAGRVVAEMHAPLVLYGVNTPSFQTYAGRAVARRAPLPGDIALTRESRVTELRGGEVIFRERGYALVRMPLSPHHFPK